MNKKTYKLLLRLNRKYKKNPFLFHLTFVSYATKRLLFRASIDSISIITYPYKSQEEKAIALMDVWIKVVENIVNIWTLLTENTGNFSIKNEFVKIFISQLKEILNHKQNK